MSHDLRYALRTLFQNKTITLVAIIALALGIGLNTAIFSVVNAVLLRPLAYRDPGRIITLLRPGSSPLAGGQFEDLRTGARSFETIAAAEAASGNLSGDGTPEQIIGLRVSDQMFSLLGVPALRGRTFAADDFVPGREGVVVISYGLWQRRFGGAADIVGRQINLDGARYDIVGVMPPGFQFAPFWVTQAEMWLPLQLKDRLHDRAGSSLRIFGRLRPGVTISQAQAEVDAICRNAARAFPDTDLNLRILVESLNEKVVGKVRPALLAILAAVGLVLLMACANVANLVLARATTRQREIAIRLSLGARRVRIVRQLLTESIVLALASSVPGVLLAVWSANALRNLVAPAAGSGRALLPHWNRISIDVSVLLFALGLALLTGIVFGIAPAVLASNSSLNRRLRESGRSVTGGGGTLRRVLVASEVALAIMLLAGAGLLMRTFLNLRGIDAGFDPHNVLTMTVSVAGQPKYVGPAREHLYREIVRSIQSVPSVRSVGLINHVPLSGDLWGLDVTVEGRPMPRGQEWNAVYRVAAAGYFTAMRLPVVSGRDFDDHDNASAPPVIMINETFARQLWPNESALGKRITVGDMRNDPHWRTIVGVVKDAKQGDWTSAPSNEIYVPLWQEPSMFAKPKGPQSYISVVARTNADAAQLANAVRDAVWSVDRGLPVSHVETLESAIGTATWQWRFNLLLMGIFASVAMVLTVVGIYGVVGYEVAQRTHEIGIRMALGAGRTGIVKLIFGQSMAVVGCGALVGVAAALAAARMLTSMLYGVNPRDPMTFTLVTFVVLVAAMLACLVPARRATTVDPLVALRQD